MCFFLQHYKYEKNNFEGLVASSLFTNNKKDILKDSLRLTDHTNSSTHLDIQKTSQKMDENWTSFSSENKTWEGEISY